MGATKEGLFSDSNRAQAIGETHGGSVTTTNATPTLAVGPIVLPDDGVWFVEVHATGDNTTVAGEDVGYHITGVVSMVAGTLAVVGTETLLAYEHANSVGCTAALSVIANKLGVAVTGEAATGYNWTASIEIQPKP